MRVCGIHQPTFFPWLGYFDKIRRSDVFVFLDRVHYQKSGSSMNSWCNRVRINTNGAATWMSCPVVREHGPQIIDTVRIDETKRPWRDEIRKTLEINYKRSAHFQEAFALVDELLRYETALIADFNMNAIRAIARRLGCEAEFVRQSELPAIDAAGSDRLAHICRAVGADTYMSGDGAGTYQDTSAFSDTGVHLIFQNFEPQPYGRPERYMPGLSVIDYLMTA